MEIKCTDFCGESNDLKPLNPRGVKADKKLSSDHEWGYVDQTLDQQLNNELNDVVRELNRLDHESEKLQNNQKEFCVQQVSTPKNAFNTRIKITQDSTTVELLKYSGCDGSNNAGKQNNQVESCDEVEQHPNTIRKYVAGMLAFFSNIRIEYLSNGKVFTRKLPVFYGNREKLLHIEEHEFQELMNGNTNFLPRASLVIDSMSYDANRQSNKNVAVQRELTYQSLAAQNAFAYITQAPSPYNIAVRLNLVTRGMNDAMMLVEQISSFFNPHYTFKMIEEGQESSIRLQLDSVNFEHPEMDQFSSNEVTVEFGFTLFGNMFKPRTKEFIIDTITLNI